LLPESLDYLLAKRPKQALERINATVNRMGLNELPVMPRYEKISTQNGSELGKLFAGQLGFQTLCLWFAFF
ncbi:MFS transporter, partial [Pseudomonas putida]|nr:MFS transporter [Pseudomonas putida]